jgi:hypothetical protein
MKQNRLLVLWLLAWILFSSLTFEDTSDRKYLLKLLELIQDPQRSVEVSLYQIPLPAGISL